MGFKGTATHPDANSDAGPRDSLPVEEPLQSYGPHETERAAQANPRHAVDGQANGFHSLPVLRRSSYGAIGKGGDLLNEDTLWSVTYNGKRLEDGPLSLQ